MFFKLYTSKLNKNCDDLWQKPRQGLINYINENWYENRIVGKDLLDRFMKINLGKSIALQGNYTNHSIRATVISTLDGDGFKARHIIALSSHKSEQTIKEYSTKCPELKRKQMFSSLSNAMLPKTKLKKHSILKQ